MDYQQLLQRYLEYDYDTLLERAKKDISQLNTYFGEEMKRDSFAVILLFIGTCLAADRSLTDAEIRFAGDLLGLSREHVLLTEKFGEDEETIDMSDEVFEMFPFEKRLELLDFCMCILAVDGSIPKDEILFITKLLEENDLL